MILPVIGPEGQAKLSRASALVVGCGALGSVIATILVRAGVGKVKLVDRDFLEYHNLQRQVLFDEDDVRRRVPKAVAARDHLRKANSMVQIDAEVTDVNFSNVEPLVRGVDVVLDGTDNLETRLLLNDACLKHNVPWVYGGAVATQGVVMSIIPGKTPCLVCAFPNPAVGTTPLTCDTAGVIAPAPFVVASLQSAEAMKIIAGAGPAAGNIIALDVWEGDFRRIEVKRRQGCPACNGDYQYLEARYGTRVASLCGQNSVQVMDPARQSFSLEGLADRLRQLGEVESNGQLLIFNADGHEVVVFPDGRAIVRGTSDQAVARGIYSRYIGS